MIAVAAGAVAAGVAVRRGGDGSLAALAMWALVRHPLSTAAAILVVVAVRRWRWVAGVTARRRAADADVVMLAELVALGLTAGRSVRTALDHAAPHLHPDLAVEVHRLTAGMDRSGASAALAVADGRLADLGRVVAGAVASGAPVAVAVAAHADHLRHARHSADVAAARRLPVRLLLPLALLILPGFVVLAVGPAVIQSLARLGPIP